MRTREATALKRWHRCFDHWGEDRSRESRPLLLGNSSACTGRRCIVCVGDSWQTPSQAPSLRIAEAHRRAAVGWGDDVDKVIDEAVPYSSAKRPVSDKEGLGGAD
jgi:hypothetical protein